MVVAPPFLHDNVLRELRRYVEAQGCSFVVFYADPEVKHQIEEFAETSGGEALVGLRTLFQHVKKNYGDGSPQGVVAGICLTYLSELELQYVFTDDDAKERRPEGRGLFGDQPWAKRKLDHLINRFAAQRCAEERARELSDWQRQRELLLRRRDELSAEIERLKAQLAGRFEETRAPAPEPPAPELPVRKKATRTKAERFPANQMGSVPPPPVADSIDDEFVIRSDAEVLEICRRLGRMSSDQLARVKEIIAPGSSDMCIRFGLRPAHSPPDLRQMPDDKFHSLKEFILKDD